jgi:tetratricopeptide (TPR) repeat protein
VRSLDPDIESRPRDAGSFAQALADHLASLEARAKNAEIETAKALATIEHERRARRLTVLLGVAVLIAISVPLVLLVAADRDRQRRGALADQAVAAANGRARTLLDVARTSNIDDREPWNAAVAAGHESRSVAANPDVPAESLVSATLLAETIEREWTEAEHRRAIVARLDELHPHGRIDDPRGTDAEYLAAFAELGVDLAADPSLAANKLAPLHCVARLAEALDELALLRRRYSVPDPDAWRIPHAIVTELDSDPVRGEIRAAFGAGDIARLESIAADASAEQPVRTLNLLARSLAESNRTTDAIRVFRIASTRYPDDYWTQHDLAALLDLTPKPPRTEISRLLGMALAARPQSAHAMIDLGRTLSLTAEFEHSIALLERATQVAPADSRAHLLLGMTYSTGNRPADALRALSRAAELGNRLAFIPLAERLIKIGDFTGALKWMTRAAESPPSELEMRKVLASRLFQFHRSELAWTVIKTVRNEQPKDEDAVGLAVSIALELGRFDDARAELESFAAAQSNAHSSSFLSMEQVVTQAAEFAALLDARETASTTDESASLRGMLGITAHRLGRSVVAYDLFASAIAETPEVLEEPSGLLAIAAINAAALAANQETDSARADGARANAYAWATNFANQIDTARRTSIFNAEIALGYLAALATIEALHELRTTRPDPEFERRFEEIRAAAVAAVTAG